MNKFLKKKVISLKMPSQEAMPGQSINVALGQFGVNISNFLKDFNEKSILYPKGMIIKVEAIISFDGSFEMTLKGPSILYLLKCLKEQKSFFERKDLILILYFIRKYRKDLNYISDFSLSKSILGILKSGFFLKNAFEK